MVDSVKQYGIAGVGSTVELGKQGPKIVGNDNQIAFQDKDGNPVSIAIGQGTDATHGVTLEQLEGIQGDMLQYVQSTVTYNSGNVSLGTATADTVIHAVVIEKVSNWSGYDAGTNITVGDDNDTRRLLKGFDPSLQTSDSMHYEYDTDTEIKAFVSSGNASAGTSTITVWYTGKIT